MLHHFLSFYFSDMFALYNHISETVSMVSNVIFDLNIHCYLSS